MTEINKYNKGKIYTIRSHKTDKFYIGSTCLPLYKRLYAHRDNQRKYINGKTNYTSSFKILEYDDHYIELLENYSCNSKNELTMREGQLIREHKINLVNIVIPCRTEKEYYIDNREKKLSQAQTYKINNHEIIKNKLDDLRKIQIKCDCGGIYKKPDKSIHEQRKIHLSFINKE
jgi:hypothetical protein